MKQILLVGGQSSKNYDFVLKLNDTIQKHGARGLVHMHNQWFMDSDEVDREIELQKLSLLPLGEVDGVVAKSLGTGMVAELLQQDRFQQGVRLVFLGFPLRVAKELGFDGYYNNLKGDITIIQNEFDPTGSRQIISDYFLSSANVKVVCVKGNETHSYEDYDLYAQMLLSFGK